MTDSLIRRGSKVRRWIALIFGRPQECPLNERLTEALALPDIHGALQEGRILLQQMLGNFSSRRAW